MEVAWSLLTLREKVWMGVDSQFLTAVRQSARRDWPGKHLSGSIEAAPAGRHEISAPEFS